MTDQYGDGGSAGVTSAAIGRLKTYWIDRETILAPVTGEGNWFFTFSTTAELHVDAAGALEGGETIALTPVVGGLSAEQARRFRHLSGYTVLRVPSLLDKAELQRILKAQTAVGATDGAGALWFLAGVQTAGLLDELLAYDGPLGAEFFCEGGIEIRLWAPTAQRVKLELFTGETDVTPALIVPMQESAGVWSAKIDSGWTNQYYLFEVRVYVASLREVVSNRVTDPYSVDLALNGKKTRLTDLTSAAQKPNGWEESKPPELEAVNDLTIYELHVRDFSIKDESVRAEHRGTYLAFTDPQTNGMRHLGALAAAGLKAIHLLPTFHIASVDEDKTTWKTTGDLSIYAADSEEQQAAVAAVQEQDGYNWGYDPVHYGTPSGGYAFRPDRRVFEYRQMVKALHEIGLRVIQDVVFNHTSASGQDGFSVLDKIVPGYYYRLDADGKVLNSSCCSDTASEHRMMEKLMVDTLARQAREYKIDGFRFDLMGFHFVANMRRIQKALGDEIYLYGEGWETGETAWGARGMNASQTNLYGTGIGLFNDRMRDGIRGGGPFSDWRIQGFATGLYTDSSRYTNGAAPADGQKAALFENTDWIRAGLAGNLREGPYADRMYGGQRTGYTAAPAENIVYASVHDNLTLFDAIQIKSSAGDSIDERVRRQILANSLVALAQGIPFFQAGDDLLRSKDMDNNSYNSGDWFNGIDFTFQTNNWGIGLPMASENGEHWPFLRPLLANPSLKPTAEHVDLTRRVFQEFLRIRYSSAWFRMRTAEEVRNHLRFLNTGTEQMPGVIVMALGQSEVLVVFNARKELIRFGDNSLAGISFRLHSEQTNSADAVAREAQFAQANGLFTVPALTTAVFVRER